MPETNPKTIMEALYQLLSDAELSFLLVKGDGLSLPASPQKCRVRFSTAGSKNAWRRMRRLIFSTSGAS